jgi:predicted metal-dependent hydrolase
MSKRTIRKPEPRKVALHARDVAFDWAGLPLRWIPGEPFASHMINVLHLLLPEGERWFVKTFAEVLPMIKDEKLLEEVLGFIGQEGMHANAHQGVVDYFDANGLDTRELVGEIEHVFQRLLGDRDLTGAARDEWLIEKVALIAAIEHMTAFLGNWILNSPGLDAAGADPQMLDLLRWHGAEEVEHRNVAYDLFNHLDGRYHRRIRTYLVAVFGIFFLWIRSTRYMLEHDQTLDEKVRTPFLPGWLAGARKGLLPGFSGIFIPLARYFSPAYHPMHEGSTSQAVAYLAKSPAAMAADAQ